MLSLKEVEFQFWEQFSQFEEEDGETLEIMSTNSFLFLMFIEITEIIDDSYQMLRGSSYKQKRLNHADMSLYGERQNMEIFSVVTCYKCGMILKQQAFQDHLKKRHNSFSLSDDLYSSSDDTNVSSEISSDNIPVNPVSLPNEPKAKRKKVDNSPNIESYPLGASPTKIYAQHNPKFLKPKSYKPRQKVIKQEPEKSGCQQIKLKLRKSDHGMWSVAAISI